MKKSYPVKESVGIVYLITNKINNHKYVGVTTLRLGRRFDFHKYHSKKLNYPLYRAIRKYGMEHFDISPIETIKCEDKKELTKRLNELEKYYIKKYNSFIRWGMGGYNLTEGGDISNISEESRKKQGETLKRKFIENPQLVILHRERIKNVYKNPVLRARISLINKERYKKQDERHKTSESIKQAYREHPELSQRSSEVHKQLNKNRPELGRQHSIRMSGHNHPFYNKTSYVFYNQITKDTFIGTPFDLRGKYDLSQSKMSLLVNGHRRSHKGWIISNNVERQEQ
jgi:group I intron endonuclease